MNHAEELQPHTRYRLTVASSLREYRYLVVDEAARDLCELRGKRLLRAYDTDGTEFARLRRSDASLVRLPTTYELLRGDLLVGTVERGLRRFTATMEGRETIAARDRRAGGYRLVRDGVLVGRLSRRRFRGRRTYDLELRLDIDPIPVLAVAVLIDQRRHLKWHMIFSD